MQFLPGLSQVPLPRASIWIFRQFEPVGATDRARK